MDTLLIYQHIPDLVQIVIWEGEQLNHCLERNDTHYIFPKEDEHSPGDWQEGKKGCIRKADFPEGIPIWKSFLLHFWVGAPHPLGPNWTLSPYDYGEFGDGNHYLGRPCLLACYRS